MYTGLSCPKLMERLNGNINYQIFCDVIIDPTRPLTNYKLLDDIMMELVRVRETVMEGSFGTQKEHYGLRRVKSRTKRTEILYIFFGIQYGKRRATGGQDRTKGAFGGCLIRKIAVNAELLWGNCIAMKNRQKIRLRRPETDIKLKF